MSGGGSNHAASGGADSISGGYGNFSEVGGGPQCMLLDATAGASISGGENNHSGAFQSYISILGGFSNTAGDGFSAVAGGKNNTANGNGSAILGGQNNTTTSNDEHIP